MSGRDILLSVADLGRLVGALAGIDIRSDEEVEADKAAMAKIERAALKPGTTVMVGDARGTIISRNGQLAYSVLLHRTHRVIGVHRDAIRKVQ